jgi:hypothetical protein
MKTRVFVIVAALAASISLGRANIISQTLASDGDGVITCDVYGLVTNSLGYQLNIDGNHNLWDAGHILGDINTDTEEDPTLALYQSIDNDTAFAWGGYLVEVTMNKSFSFSNIGVVNSGWTISQSAVNQVGTNWIGSIQYSAGVPVQVGNSLNFNYAVTFYGSAKFCEQLTPIAVPEPGTFALVACGLAGLWVLRRRSAT